MKRRRPESLPSRTHRMHTACGNLYIIVTRHDGAVFEVFAMLGKAGGCAFTQTVAMTRVVSAALRSGVDPREIVSALHGLSCPGAITYPEDEAALSCPDAVARVIIKECQL